MKRRARREPVPAYTRFVRRIWAAIENRTGREPFYLDARHICSYCPACLDGTLRIGFVDHPRPGFTIDSNQSGPGRCSRGCTELEVAGALA